MPHRRWTFRVGVATVASASLLVLAVGCGQGDPAGTQNTHVASEKKIAEARGKLPAEDRALADAQDYCAVHREQKLGSMGVPLKLTIKGRPVFLCCKGCKGAAEDDPDATLKAAEDLKAGGKKE